MSVSFRSQIANEFNFERYVFDATELSSYPLLSPTLCGDMGMALGNVVRLPTEAARIEVASALPSFAELVYLRRGLSQPGGKLPVFDLDGQQVGDDVVRRCIDLGWAEPWFANKLKPDWLVCKLTQHGRRIAGES